MRTLTKPMLRQAMIDRNGKKWNTRPERLFNEYQISRCLGLIQNVNVGMVAKDRDGRENCFVFQLDFARPKDRDRYAATGFHDLDAGYDVDYETDGDGHKAKNDAWKDEVKNAHGLKVLHIPGWLCEKKWWGNLDAAIPKALASGKMAVNLGEIA
jgi:hypothetical protein